MFLQVSVCPQGGHAWLLAGGVCAWLLRGGMHGCSGGHAWLLGGACVVAPGGMHGCSRGACVVAPGGHAWLLWGACMVAPGGVHGCSEGHAWLLRGACVVARGGVRGFFDEIRSMSGRYASYWNAFLFSFTGSIAQNCGVCYNGGSMWHCFGGNLFYCHCPKPYFGRRCEWISMKLEQFNI